MKTLEEIANFLGRSESFEPCAFMDCWVDARSVTPNSIFIALQGQRNHGLDFVDQVLEQGATLILVSAEELSLEKNQILKRVQAEQKVMIWQVTKLESKLAEFSSWFYDNPSQKLKIIGITGTNGKTSTAHFTAQLLHKMGQKVALMGTLGNGIFGALKPSPNTTLEVVSLNRQLSAYVEKQVEFVVMEVSSHAIALQRISRIEFEVVALTQVTRDHLDFHETIEVYEQVKSQLFTDYPAKFKVLNIDDALGKRLKNAIRPSNVVTYSLTQPADIRCESTTFSLSGIKGTVVASAQKYDCHTPLMGVFNVENVLCSLAIARNFNFEIPQLVQAVAELEPIIGRMELVQHQPAVIVDYAHTPDALLAVLKSAKAHLKTGKLRVVFGCGGDRDKGKRPLMAKVVEIYADQIILTDDNPRWEDPKDIMQMIQAGLQTSALVIHDRSSAIHYALQQAQLEDLIVIAGKGHEAYQEVKGIQYPMRDQDIVKNWKTHDRNDNKVGG